MDDDFLVLVDSICTDDNAVAILCPETRPPHPLLQRRGYRIVHIYNNTILDEVVSAVMLLRVRQGVRGRTRRRHADLRCSACAAPKDKAHHTEDTGQS